MPVTKEDSLIFRFVLCIFTTREHTNAKGYATFILRLSFNEKGFPFSKNFYVLTRTQPIAKISWIKPLSPHWKWRWRNNKKNYANYVTGIIRRMKGNFLHITQNNTDPAFNKIFVDIVARCVSSKIVDVIRCVGFLLIFVYL